MSGPTSGGTGAPSSRPRRRRLVPGWVLVVAFVVVPLIEIFVLVQVGQVIGAWWTIALLILASVIGSWLIKREGSRAWRALQESLHAGRMPARELADGAMILIGGTLMLTPGFVSDVVGTVLILPFTRPLARRALTGVVAARLTAHPAGPAAGQHFGPGSGSGADFGDGFGPRAPRGPASGPGPVVQGEVVDPDRPDRPDRPDEPPSS